MLTSILRTDVSGAQPRLYEAKSHKLEGVKIELLSEALTSLISLSLLKERMIR